MIGEKILAAREAANMTQEELGKAVGVSRDTIRRWEKESRETRGRSERRK